MRSVLDLQVFDESFLILFMQVLEHLNLSNNPLGDTAVVSLLTNWRPPPNFQELNLSGVKLSSAALTALTSLMREPLCPLRSIKIAYNANICGLREEGTFDPAPGIELATVLQQVNRSVQQLDLSWNDIGARVAASLTEATITNQVLHSLDLRGCHISDVGAERIGAALPHISRLRWLDVSSCAIGPVGCQVV